MTKRSVIRVVISRCTLIGLYAIPVALPLALLLRKHGDTSTGPNFVVLGLLGVLTGCSVAMVNCTRHRCLPWRGPARWWAFAAAANLMVVVVAAGAIDFGGFAGGGH